LLIGGGGIARLNSFLNDIERIAARDYEPSDNDVIRARLRTLGVQEYSFWVEQGTSPVSFCLEQRLQIEPALQPDMNG
jgi:hypothetical protein